MSMQLSLWLKLQLANKGGPYLAAALFSDQSYGNDEKVNFCIYNLHRSI